MLRVKLRQVVFTAHLWLGLTVGLWFSLMGLTGSLLVFYHEWEAATIPEIRHVVPPQPEAPALPLSQVMARVREQLPTVPETELSRLQFPKEPGGAYRLQIGEHSAVQTVREVVIDPYTGRILRNYRLIDSPLGFVVLLHIYLLFGEAGEAINGGLGLVATFLLLSGLWLWWPVTVQQWRTRFAVKSKASRLRVLFDLHNVFGIYALPVLLVSVVTGISIVFREPVQVAVYALTRTPDDPFHARVKEPVKLQGESTAERLPLEQLVRVAERAGASARIERVTYPTKPDKPLIVRKSRGETGLFSRITVTLNPYTGEVLRVEDEQTTSPGKKILRGLTRLHFGWWGGLPGKIVYALAGLAPSGLLLTGLIKYRLRENARIANRARR